MNAPMTGTSKTIYATTQGIELPINIKKLLIGAVIMWEDKNPLSENMDDVLHFFFDSKTTKTTDILLARYGIKDIGQIVNVEFKWQVEMELKYKMPNHPNKKEFIDKFPFKFRGTVFPMNKAFKVLRDNFYLVNNLERVMTPDDHKNKGIYEMSYYKLTIIGV